MRTQTIIGAAVVVLLAAATAAAVIQERREARLPDSGTPIVFRPVESAQDRATILDIVARAGREFRLRDLTGALERGELRIADLDIDRDGKPEYFVTNAASAFCSPRGCVGQLFWLIDGAWFDWVGYVMPESGAWGAKRPGFRDYVVDTGYSREIFPFPHGRDIRARLLKTDEERAVALEHLEREIDMSVDEEFPGWRAAIDDERIMIAEADLDDDGRDERFIIVTGYGLCGTIGCQALLLRKVGDKWKTTTGLSLFDGFLLLDDKKFGWHRIFTGEEIYTFRGGAFFESVEIDGAHIGRGEKSGPTP